MTEEYKEFLDAIHSKNYENMKEEIIDIAVSAIFGLACIQANTIDW